MLPCLRLSTHRAWLAPHSAVADLRPLGVSARVLSMKAISFAAVACLLVSSPAFAVDAVKGFETDNIVLYQPDEDLRELLPNGDVTDLANYIKQIQAVCTGFFATTITKPENFTIVVAIRPAKRSRVWFISSILPPT